MARMHRLSVGLAATALFGFGCGGGGGGGSGGASGPSITPENAALVGGSAYDGATSSANTGGYASGGGGEAMPLSLRRGSGSAFDYGSFVRRAVRQAMEGGSGTVQPASGASANEPCTDGGSIRLVLDDADGSQTLSGGDWARIEFRACEESGWLFGGFFELRFASVSGDPDWQWQATGTIEFGELSVQSLATGEHLLIDGTIAFDVSDDGWGDTNGTIDTARLHVETRDRVVDLFDTRATASESSSGDATASADGTMQTSTSPGHVYRFVTVAPFVFYGGDSVPSGGAVTVTGEDGAFLRMTVLSYGTVEIEIDREGDGVIDEVIQRDWSGISDVPQ